MEKHQLIQLGSKIIALEGSDFLFEGLVRSNNISVDGNILHLTNFESQKITVSNEILIPFGLSFREIRLSKVTSPIIEIQGIENTIISITRCNIKTGDFLNCKKIELKFYESDTHGEMYLNYSKTEFSKILINNSKPNKMPAFHLLPHKEEDKLDSTINHFEIISENFQEPCGITFIHINQFVMNNIHLKSLHISGCKIDNIQLFNVKDDRQSKSKICFDNVAPLSIKNNILSIGYCDLKHNLEFKNSDLSEYNIELKDSNIKSTQFNNTKLPVKVNLKYNNVGSKDDFYRQQQETILQLKHIAENRKDSYAAMKIKILEQAVTFRLLKFWKNIPDGIVLGLSFLSNYFGKYWLLSAIWYLAVGLFFYTLLILLNQQDFNLNLFAIFLNPTHQIADVFGKIEGLCPATGLIDYFTRILYAYLIVQTVTAFRKILK